MNAGTTLGLLAIGMILDVASLLCELSWNVRRRGPSGVPVIPWMLYALAALAGAELVPFRGSPELAFRLLNLLLLTGLHWLLQSAIPGLHRRLVQRSRP